MNLATNTQKDESRYKLSGLISLVKNRGCEVYDLQSATTNLWGPVTG